MPKEDDLEREWRVLVSNKLDQIDKKADSIEKDIHRVELELANLTAVKLIPRVERLEQKVGHLESFRGKIIAVVVSVQILAGAVWGLFKVFLDK